MNATRFPLPFLAALALLVPAAATGTSVGTGPEPASVILPAEVKRVLTDYEAAWQKKDAAALAALFIEDGFVLASGAEPVHGRAAIAKHYAGQGGPLFLRAFAYATDDSTGWIIGGYTGNRETPDEGKFTLTLRKRGGRWLIASDMDNLNARR